VYTLTLTYGQRLAIDWVGHRYGHGNDLADILLESEGWDTTDYGELLGWDSRGDITFTLTEPQAWQIAEIRQEGMEGGHSPWTCFDGELVGKMEAFCDSIV